MHLKVWTPRFAAGGAIEAVHLRPADHIYKYAFDPPVTAFPFGRYVTHVIFVGFPAVPKIPFRFSNWASSSQKYICLIPPVQKFLVVGDQARSKILSPPPRTSEIRVPLRQFQTRTV